MRGQQFEPYSSPEMVREGCILEISKVETKGGVSSLGVGVRGNKEV
jgi:hypothetical protein